MGLRCLLGHDFDEPETERERNEEGNEVVVTVREVKTCKRCGEKQVVSENKEITSIDQLRESATGEPASESHDTAQETTDAGAQWRNDELSTGGREDAAAEAESSSPSESTASEPTASESTPAEPQPTDAGAVGESEADAVDRGVADIIEQAEKDDDMLRTEPESAEPESAEASAESSASTETAADEESAELLDEDDEVPVHPGQRGPDDDEEEPEPEEDDGVILEDDDARPEEARRQWEEEASPEEVPGDDLNVGEPIAPDGEDAEIIDAGPETVDHSEQAPEPDEPTSAPAAPDGEDAEILDAGPELSNEPTTEPEPELEPEPEPEPTTTESEPETTDEGHMPWPDAPGEDEGHDASVPDGEPADVDFGSGLTPSDADREEPASKRTDAGAASTPESPSEPASQSEPEAETPTTESTPDRSNGHRTETGEQSQSSAAPTSNVDLEQSSRDAGMEYVCPECGLSRDVGNSSMRAGDICPECRKGYITEQQKAE